MQAYKTATALSGRVMIHPRLQPNICTRESIYHGWLVKVEEWRIADSTKTGETVEIVIEPAELESHLRTAIKVSFTGTIDLNFPMSFSPDLHVVAILKSIYFLPITGKDLGAVHRKTLTLALVPREGKYIT